MDSTTLSSDILEQQFGPTTVRILHQDENLRLIQTIAVQYGHVLELSLVRFMSEGVKAFPEAHAAIRAGESMGKAFRNRSIEFTRQEEFAVKHDVSGSMATVVGVMILVGPNKIPYARIVETYNKTVKWPRLFGRLTPKVQEDLSVLKEISSTTT